MRYAYENINAQCRGLGGVEDNSVVALIARELGKTQRRERNNYGYGYTESAELARWENNAPPQQASQKLRD
jgi:hypothetical protein